MIEATGTTKGGDSESEASTNARGVRGERGSCDPTCEGKLASDNVGISCSITNHGDHGEACEAWKGPDAVTLKTRYTGIWA